MPTSPAARARREPARHRAARRSTSRAPSRAPTATSSCANDEQITDVRVSEGGAAYEPGGAHCARLPRPPRRLRDHADCRTGRGSSGTTGRPTSSARSRSPTGSIGGAVAYDDVIDVGWQVWGDQWDFDLDHLTASLERPGARSGRPRLPRLGPSARRRGRDRARRRGRDARGHRRPRRSVRRDAGDRAADAGPERQRRPAAATATGLPKILAEEQGLDEDFDSFPNPQKRWIADNALLLALILAGARGAGPVPLRPARARAPDEHARVPARAARRRHPGARLRPRPRGLRQRRHRARDPARPRRPRLLRDQLGDHRRGGARPRAEGARQTGRTRSSPRTRRRCCRSSTSCSTARRWR